MFANGTTRQASNAEDFSTYEKLYQIRDPKGAVKWVMSVTNKVMEQFCKPGMGNNGFRHLSTQDVVGHSETLKAYWPTFVENGICKEVNAEMEEQILAAFGHVIDGNKIVAVEAKWPHDLIKEIEGIKIFEITAPQDVIYYDHRYHDMFQGDSGGGDSYNDHDHVFADGRSQVPKNDERRHFLLVQGEKVLYGVRYEKRQWRKEGEKREHVLIPTITAQGTDTDTGLPLESGVIINPKVRK